MMLLTKKRIDLTKVERGIEIEVGVATGKYF